MLGLPDNTPLRALILIEGQWSEVWNGTVAELEARNQLSDAESAALRYDLLCIGHQESCINDTRFRVEVLGRYALLVTTRSYSSVHRYMEREHAMVVAARLMVATPSIAVVITDLETGEVLMHHAPPVFNRPTIAAVA